MTVEPTADRTADLRFLRLQLKALMERSIRLGELRLFEELPEPPGERLRGAGALRADLEKSAREHRLEGLEALSVLGDETVLEVAEEVGRDIRARLPLERLLEHVAFEKGRWMDIQVWTAQGDFEDIRVVFQAIHRDQPDVRNALDALPNRALREAVEVLQRGRSIPRRRRVGLPGELDDAETRRRRHDAVPGGAEGSSPGRS